MLKLANYDNGDIIAMDRAYINYARFEELTNRGVTYVTKMKKNLVYDTLSDTMYMLPCGLMECRVQVVEFRKNIKGGEDIDISSVRYNQVVSDFVEAMPQIIGVIVSRDTTVVTD